MTKELKKATYESMSKLGKILYKLGAFDLKRLNEDSLDIRVLAKFRVYNPISWIVITLAFWTYVFCEGFPTAIDEFTTSEVIYVSKNKLKKKDVDFK